MENSILANLDFICKNSTDLEVVLTNLYSHKVISERQHQEIENHRTDYKRFGLLYKIIMQKCSHPKVQESLIIALKSSGNEHIIEKLSENCGCGSTEVVQLIPISKVQPTAITAFTDAIDGLVKDLAAVNPLAAEGLRNCNSPFVKWLGLVAVHRNYMKQRLHHLREKHIQWFMNYKYSDSFLKLSITNLQEVLSSDDLAMKEKHIFEATCSWAESECKRMNVEANPENFRHTLGDCFYEIRFPLMSVTQFTDAVCKIKITTEEKLDVYELIGMKNKLKLNLNESKSVFKIKPRKCPLKHQIKNKLVPIILPKQIEVNQPVPLKHLPSIAQPVQPKPEIPQECLILSLTKDLPIVESSEAENGLSIAPNKKIKLHGLGFLGPLETDAVYYVTVRITKHCQRMETFVTVKIEKEIFAQKGKTFQFIFDEPVIFTPISLEELDNRYKIDYCLKGPKTHVVQRLVEHDSLLLVVGDTEFRLWWRSNQLAEILFTRAMF